MTDLAQPTNQKLYAGKWTQEEEDYVDGLIENFRVGNIPDIPDGTTLRSYLAKMLGCRVKRISKRYERTGYNGRAQYKHKEAGLSDQEYRLLSDKLEGLRLAFWNSRNQVMQGLAYARGSRRASRAPGSMFSSSKSIGTSTAASLPNNHAAMASTLSGMNLMTSNSTQETALLRAVLIHKLGLSIPPTPYAGSSAGLAEMLRRRRQLELMQQQQQQSNLFASVMGMPGANGGPSAA